MKIPVVSIEGKELRTVEVDDSVFGIAPNMAVLHQAYVRQRNNQRGGNASTKTRGEVAGSTRKIRMQKYTGRARAGSNRSPTRVGGGTAFGPRPRSYAQDMPKKMRRLAIRSALSGKVADGQLVVVDQLAFAAPRTQEVSRILRNVGFERSALLVTAESDRMVLASVKNLHKTKVLPANYLNVADMLNHAGLLITEDALRIAENLWGQQDNGKAAAPRPAARAKAAPSETEEQPKARARKMAAEAVAAEAAVEAPEATVAAAEAPAVEKPKRAPSAKAAAPAAEKAAAKPARAPRKTAAKPKTSAEEKTKSAARKTAAKPKASAEEKPKPAARKAAAKPKTSAEEKPKRAPRAKKTEEGK